MWEWEDQDDTTTPDDTSVASDIAERQNREIERRKEVLRIEQQLAELTK